MAAPLKRRRTEPLLNPLLKALLNPLAKVIGPTEKTLALTMGPGRLRVMREQTWLATIVFLLCAPLGGCGAEASEVDPEPTTESETPDETPEAEVAPEPEVAAVDESAAPRAATDSYVVELRPQEGYAAGELGQFALHLEGQGEWHLNQDFPFAITVSHADGLQLPKTALEKTDARSFEDEGADFDVPFTPSAAGEHPLSARVEFAVCNPSSCVPQNAVVGLRIAVAE